MNNRIRELAQQTDIWCDQNFHNSPAYNLQWEQKFAELIVRECAKVIRDSVQTMERGKLRANIAHQATVLEQHFGVEK